MSWLNEATVETAGDRLTKTYFSKLSEVQKEKVKARDSGLEVSGVFWDTDSMAISA